LRGIHFLTVRPCLTHRNSVAAPPAASQSQGARQPCVSLNSSDKCGVLQAHTSALSLAALCSGGLGDVRTDSPAANHMVLGVGGHRLDKPLTSPTPLSFKFPQHSMIKRTGALFFKHFKFQVSVASGKGRRMAEQVTNCSMRPASVFRIPNCCRPSFYPSAILPQTPLSSRR